ncbi:major facilitator superfamily domain-containing protein [Aspergillus varians]
MVSARLGHRGHQRPSIEVILSPDDIAYEVAITSSSSTSSPPAASPKATDPPIETPPAAIPTTTSEPPQDHSAFSTTQKRFIVTMVTLASFFSPLSSQIYYPVVPTLAQNYHLTNALINLTITIYMILQGLTPPFIDTFDDTCGRRPAYILAFTVYTAANIGLAVQDSYQALMVLRCVQSAGSSGTVSFGYGVIADIATPAEQGSYVGPMTAGVMLAPALGPVIGGLLAKVLGWRSVFWFLAIVSGGYLVAYVLFVPETARSVVGDGSLLPEWWRMSVAQWWRQRRKTVFDIDVDGDYADGQNVSATETTTATATASKLSFPNPLKSLAILLELDALILILSIGLLMLSNVALLTSIPSLFFEIYGYNTLQIGLCLLPLGIGGSLSAILTGHLLNHNYRRHAAALNLPINRSHTTSLQNFPIEHARLQPFFPFIALTIATVLPYGFALHQRTHVAVPLALQFLNGFATIACTNTLKTLLIDLFPESPATAAAACNLVRCWLGALGAGIVDYMLRVMGWGWCFVFLGALMAISVGLVWVEYVWGRGWREGRRVKRLRLRLSGGVSERTTEDPRGEGGVNDLGKDGTGIDTTTGTGTGGENLLEMPTQSRWIDS